MEKTKEVEFTRQKTGILHLSLHLPDTLKVRVRESEGRDELTPWLNLVWGGKHPCKKES